MEAIPGVVLYISIIIGASAAAGTAVEISEEVFAEGEQITEDVMIDLVTGLRILSMYGVSSTDGSSIEELTMTIGLSTGCTTVDLNNTLLEIKGEEDPSSFSMNSSSDVSIEFIRDLSTNSSEMVMGKGDLVKIKVKVDLEAGERFEIIFYTFPGGVSRSYHHVPDVLLNRIVSIR